MTCEHRDDTSAVTTGETGNSPAMMEADLYDALSRHLRGVPGASDEIRTRLAQQLQVLRTQG